MAPNNNPFCLDGVVDVVVVGCEGVNSFGLFVTAADVDDGEDVATIAAAGAVGVNLVDQMSGSSSSQSQSYHHYLTCS